MLIVGIGAPCAVRASADRCVDGAERPTLVSRKRNFAFRRMHVHVHRVGWQSDVEATMGARPTINAVGNVFYDGVVGACDLGHPAMGCRRKHILRVAR